MRIGYLDMTELDHTCPSGFDVITSPITACMRMTAPGCTSVMYSSHGIEYTKVCGRVRAYKSGTTDSFTTNNLLDIDDNYIDGVSITHGSDPRRHIWSFAAGFSEDGGGTSVCPCTSGTFTGTVPNFVGNNNYFCESTSSAGTNEIIVDDPLWDGRGCPIGNTCCSLNKPPLFCTQVDASSDNVELRVCSSAGSSDEDILLEMVYLFVK